MPPEVLDDQIAQELEDLARIGFVAYNDQAGGKTWDNRAIPPWDQTGDRVQRNWKAAAAAIEAEVLKRHGLK